MSRWIPNYFVSGLLLAHLLVIPLSNQAASTLYRSLSRSRRRRRSALQEGDCQAYVLRVVILIALVHDS